MENFIEIYNPRNASKLSDEQIQAMQHLTDDQIKALAEAYPNQPTGNAYLRYYVKTDPADKQRFPLGTWKNLHSLRKLGKKEIVPFGFIKGRVQATFNKAVVTGKKTVDLASTDALEGMKTGGIADVNVAAKADFEGAVNTDAENGMVMHTDAEIAYDTALAELNAAVESKSHPQTIKKLERAVEAAKEVLEAEKSSQ